MLEPPQPGTRNSRVPKTIDMDPYYKRSNLARARSLNRFVKETSITYSISNPLSHVGGIETMGSISPTYARSLITSAHMNQIPTVKGKPSIDVLIRSLSDVKNRVRVYFSVVAALAAVNLLLIASQSLPTAVTIPLLGGLLIALFLVSTFAFLLVRGRNLNSN
jgi:hypothetical protein